MDDVRALAAYVHELHVKLAKLLIRYLNDATDEYHRPYPCGLLEDYLKAVDELGERSSVPHREPFYPQEDDV